MSSVEIIIYDLVPPDGDSTRRGYHTKVTNHGAVWITDEGKNTIQIFTSDWPKLRDHIDETFVKAHKYTQAVKLEQEYE